LYKLHHIQKQNPLDYDWTLVAEAIFNRVTYFANSACQWMKST